MLFRSSDLKKYKAEMHVNLAVLRNPQLKPARVPRRRPRDELGEKEDENEQQSVEEDTSINDESNAEQLTQLILCRNGRELRLLPTGDSETFTQGPLRAVVRSSRQGIRVFRPEE